MVGPRKGYRKFDGQTYALGSLFFDQDRVQFNFYQANQDRQARRLRELGANARVVKGKGWSAVYVRMPKRRRRRPSLTIPVQASAYGTKRNFSREEEDSRRETAERVQDSECTTNMGGSCYQQSGDMLLGLSDDAMLIHANVNPIVGPMANIGAYGHSFIYINGMIIDPNSGYIGSARGVFEAGGLDPECLPGGARYGKCEDVNVYSKDEALRMVIEYNTWGPWGEEMDWYHSGGNPEADAERMIAIQRFTNIDEAVDWMTDDRSHGDEYLAAAAAEIARDWEPSDLDVNKFVTKTIERMYSNQSEEME